MVQVASALVPWKRSPVVAVMMQGSGPCTQSWAGYCRKIRKGGPGPALKRWNLNASSGPRSHLLLSHHWGQKSTTAAPFRCKAWLLVSVNHGGHLRGQRGFLPWQWVRDHSCEHRESLSEVTRISWDDLCQALDSADVQVAWAPPGLYFRNHAGSSKARSGWVASGPAATSKLLLARLNFHVKIWISRCFRNKKNSGTTDPALPLITAGAEWHLPLQPGHDDPFSTVPSTPYCITLAVFPRGYFWPDLCRCLNLQSVLSLSSCFFPFHTFQDFCHDLCIKKKKRKKKSKQKG